MSTGINERIIWVSPNGLWKVFGRIKDVGVVEVYETRIMKLIRGRFEFFYGKNAPVYVREKHLEIDAYVQGKRRKL